MPSYEELYNHPALSLYQSDAVPAGSAVRLGDKVFLNPRDMHELRSQLMNERPLTKHEARMARARRLPLPARIGATVVLALVLIVWPVSCAVNSAAYQRCVDELVAERGFDSPNNAILEECR